MSAAIDDLKGEHEAILSSLRILAAIRLRIDRKLDIEKRDIWNLVTFLKDFADTCHHGKEEGILFPALVKAGIPEKGGPVGVMLAEHAQGRTLIKAMNAAATGAPDYPKFITAASDYAALLAAHIDKENSVLFPMAEKALDAETFARIRGAFEQHEQKVIGAERHAELRELLRKLEQKYPI
jgi:hemerythrin-like domain-containing protein